MKPVAIIIALLIAGTANGAESGSPQPSARGTLAGRVFVRGTRDPAGFANVVALGTRLGSLADSTGRFVLEGLPVGTVNVRVQVIGFKSLLLAAQIRSGETTFVSPEVVPFSGPAMEKYAPALRESVGADVAGVGDSLVCHIEPFCARIWPEEVPRFRVSITNRSSRAVDLVLPKDGSGFWRSPRVTFDFQGPGRGAPTSYGARIDDSMNGMQLEDFVPLAPGKRLDLFGARGYAPSEWRFERPGQYVVEFEYSTAEDNLRRWLGDWQPDGLGEQWRSKFRRVARVDLHAECTFDVQQR